MTDFEYKLLTPAEKIVAVKERLRVLETNHYQQSLAYLGITPPPEENQHLDLLKEQIIAAQRELEALEAEK